MLVEKLKALDFTHRWRVTVTDAKLNRSHEQNERLWQLSTTKLTTSDMTEYQNSIEIWAQTNLGWMWDYNEL